MALISLFHVLIRLSCPVGSARFLSVFLPLPPSSLFSPPYLLLFSLHFIPLLFPDLRESESYLFAVLSSLHCVQSAPRRQNKDVFHLQALRPFLFFDVINRAPFIFSSWKASLWLLFLTAVWKPRGHVPTGTERLSGIVWFQMLTLSVLFSLTLVTADLLP